MKCQETQSNGNCHIGYTYKLIAKVKLCTRQLKYQNECLNHINQQRVESCIHSKNPKQISKNIISTWEKSYNILIMFNYRTQAKTKSRYVKIIKQALYKNSSMQSKQEGSQNKS